MASEDRIAVFDLSGGADRRRSSLSRPASKLLDVCNLLPRSPLGAKAIRLHATETTGATGTTDILPANRAAGTLALVARKAAAYADLLGGGLPSITFAAADLNNIAAFRGQIAVAQQGARIQLVDLTASTCTSLSQSPKAGVCCEYKSMLWGAADTADDDSSPAVVIPLVGVVIPPPQVSILKSGTADVTYNESLGTSTILDTSLADGVFTGCVGKIILIGGAGYAITAISTTTHTNDTATVTAVSGKPDSATGEAYQVLASVPLVAYPDTLNMGTVYLFNDSGKADCRVFNCGSTPIRVTAVRPKGTEVRVEDLATLPATIPPGGSLSFAVIYTPASENACSASIVVEHDFYAQSSLIIPVVCTGTTREVLASPSVVHFGAWIVGSTSPAVAIEIKNPLTDAITLESGGWSVVEVGSGLHFAWDTPSATPTADITIDPGKSYTIKIKFTPPAGHTGALTGSITFQRTVPAKPYRVWRSRPGDATNWRRDREWTDLSADGLAGGAVRSIRAYDDALICHKDASIWAIVPGGLDGGYRPVQLALGEGVGAFGPQAVCTGGGALWWASKAGIFRLQNQDIKCVSDPIEDLIWTLAANQFSSVRLVWYDNMLVVALPTISPFATGMLWAFKPDYPDANGSWWRLNYAPTALVVDKGATRKEALYGVVGDNLLHLDETVAAGVAWSLETPLIMGQDADALKKIVGLSLDISEEALVSSAKATFSNGSQSMAILSSLESGVSLAGVAAYSVVGGVGVLTTGTHGYAVNALTGLTGTIAGAAVTVASNTTTTITFTTAVSGLPAMNVTFVLGKGTPTTLTKIRGLYGEGAVGSQFSILVSGTTVSSGRGEVGGFSVDYEPVCKERIDE